MSLDIKQLVDTINQAINNVDQITDINILQQILSNVNKVIHTLEQRKSILQAQNTITKKGYYLSKEELDIPETKHFKLYYYVKMITYDNEYQNDPKIDDIEEDQLDWVKLLKFEYLPDSKDLIDSDDIIWDHDSYDPKIGRAPITFYLYYPKIQTLPTTGEFYTVEVDDGAVNHYKIENDKIININSGKDETTNLNNDINTYDLCIVKN